MTDYSLKGANNNITHDVNIWVRCKKVQLVWSLNLAGGTFLHIAPLSPDDEFCFFSSTTHLVLCCTQETNLDSEATGWKKGATESELGDLRTSHSVEADEVNREKTKEWKGKKKIRLLPLFFFFFFAQGRGHRSSQRGVIIVEPPRSWPGKGRRRLCTRLATNLRRSSRCWWWCHRGRRISRRRRLKHEDKEVTKEHEVFIELKRWANNSISQSTEH